MPAWWRTLQRAALDGGATTAAGVARVAAAAALAERAVRESTQVEPGEARTPLAQRWHPGPWALEALLVACAALLLGWSAAVFRGISEDSGNQLDLSVAGHVIGTNASVIQYQYLGLDVGAGFLAVFLAHRLRVAAPLFLVPIVAGAVHGLTGYVPGFSAVTFPRTIGVWLVKVGDFWGEWIVWIGIAYFIGAMMLCSRVTHLARDSGGLSDGTNADRRMPRIRAGSPASPYVAFTLLLASFVTLAWATEIVRDETWLGSRFPAPALPDNQIGRFLPLLVVLAAAGTVAARRGGGWLAVLSLAVVAGAVWPQLQLPGVLDSAFLGGVIDWFDQLFGGSVLWAAVGLVALAICMWIPTARTVRR
jgi:hypothetical protein